MQRKARRSLDRQHRIGSPPGRSDRSSEMGEVLRRAHSRPRARQGPRGRHRVVGDKVVGEEVERLPLLNITYEDGDDQVAIGVGGRGRRFPAALWHYVEKPRLIWVHEHDGWPTAIAIESEDGTLTLLSVHADADD